MEPLEYEENIRTLEQEIKLFIATLTEFYEVDSICLEIKDAEGLIFVFKS